MTNNIFLMSFIFIYYGGLFFLSLIIIFLLLFGSYLIKRAHPIYGLLLFCFLFPFVFYLCEVTNGLLIKSKIEDNKYGCPIKIIDDNNNNRASISSFIFIVPFINKVRYKINGT